jgi:hypothetical protein
VRAGAKGGLLEATVEHHSTRGQRGRLQDGCYATGRNPTSPAPTARAFAADQPFAIG